MLGCLRRFLARRRTAAENRAAPVDLGPLLQRAMRMRSLLPPPHPAAPVARKPMPWGVPRRSVSPHPTVAATPETTTHHIHVDPGPSIADMIDDGLARARVLLVDDSTAFDTSSCDSGITPADCARGVATDSGAP